MVDHRMRAEIFDPFAAFRPRGGADDGQLRELAGELYGQRANAAGRPDDEQLRPRVPGRHLQPVEQPFPGGERGQRQGGGFSEAEALRFVAGNTLVDEMQFGIGARPVQIAGVEHRIARPEQGDLRSHRLDDAGGVPAEDDRRLVRTGAAHAHLGVHRIDRDCLHAHQQVARTRHRGGGVEIEERAFLGDGQRLDVADGFHGGLLRAAHMS